MRRNNLFSHFPLSHLKHTKHFIDDFLYDQLLHLPFEHEQVAVIGLMLSVTTLSCQCGTNELAGSGFQPHSIGQVCWFQFHSASKSSQPGYMLFLYVEGFQMGMELAS